MNENIRKFTQMILAWEERDELLFPEDVLNFLMDFDIVTEEEISYLRQEKPVDIRLPSKYST